jgi:NADH-quinone oxidoreductase subunit C
MPHETTLKKLAEHFGPDACATSEFRDNFRIECPREKLSELLRQLKESCGFDMLADITAVDYLEYEGARDRFRVIYSLASTENNERVYVRVPLNDPELSLPSVVSLWQGANWMEREVYDMFGIRFDGHPDLRRILLPDEFMAFPLRKDYSLRGRGERHNFPVLTRSEG